MFIELAVGETERRRSGMSHMSLLRSVRYRATHSINNPRLRRSGIREFANSIVEPGYMRPRRVILESDDFLAKGNGGGR